MAVVKGLCLFVGGSQSMHLATWETMGPLGPDGGAPAADTRGGPHGGPANLKAS